MSEPIRRGEDVMPEEWLLMQGLTRIQVARMLAVRVMYMLGHFEDDDPYRALEDEG